MAAKKPYRITPSLGPDLHQAATQFYWDTIGDPTGAGQPSYQPGSKVTGNDGHVYVFVRAAANIAANGNVEIFPLKVGLKNARRIGIIFNYQHPTLTHCLFL